MNILVTGAKGMVGTALVNNLKNIRDGKNRIRNIEINEIEYSCAVTPQVRQTGNRLSGLAGTAYASLLT